MTPEEEKNKELAEESIRLLQKIEFKEFLNRCQANVRKYIKRGRDYDPTEQEKKDLAEGTSVLTIMASETVDAARIRVISNYPFYDMSRDDRYLSKEKFLAIFDESVKKLEEIQNLTT